LKAELELEVEVEPAIYASYAISLLMAAEVIVLFVTLCVQLTRDLLAIAKFLVDGVIKK